MTPFNGSLFIYCVSFFMYLFIRNKHFDDAVCCQTIFLTLFFGLAPWNSFEWKILPKNVAGITDNRLIMLAITVIWKVFSQ